MALCLVGTTPIAAQSKEASENNEVSDTYGHHEIADSLEQPAPGSNDYLRKTNKVFVVVEKMPSFPKGNSALMEYIQNNILYLYAEEAIKNNESGRVIVSFVIEKDGSTTNGKVVRSVSPSLDKEALRIIDFMPSWNPGKQKGVPVRVKYTLPIDFKL